MQDKSHKLEERELRHRTVGKLLKAARIKRGLTQLDIGKILGYSSSQFVSNWERGEALPPMDHFPKLVSILNLNVNELIDCIHRYQEKFLVLEKRRIVELLTKTRERGRRR